MFGNRLFKKWGYKKVRISGANFIIKKLTPLDFLDSEGVPFTLFHVERPKTIYEQVLIEQAKNADEEEKKKQKIELIKKILNVGVVKYPYPELNPEDYLTVATLDTGIALYAQILIHSLSIFIRPYAINRGQLRYWDLMAKRYGKLPIQCLMPNGGYSEVDAFIFNSFVLNEAIKEENAEMKKAMAKKDKR